MTQAFKENDVTEFKMRECANGVIETIRDELDAFYSGAFTAYPLGDVLYVLGRDPMVGKVSLDFFRVSFPQIHDLFTRPATFEFFLDVLNAIWGSENPIEFDRTAPGVLEISIPALSLQDHDALFRIIEDGNYVYYNFVTTGDEDQIIFQTATGIKNQTEADALIEEISAAGTVTIIDLGIA